MPEINLNLAPFTEAEQSLNILTVANGVMTNDPRLHELIDKIEQTGASVRRLFPSADIITVECTQDQLETLQGLNEITAANLHRSSLRPAVATEF